MSKQDRQGVRTARDLERKYDFKKLKRGFQPAGGGTKVDVDAVAAEAAKRVMQGVYPVGSVYFACEGIDPGALFGGNWEQLQLEGMEGIYAWKRVEE